MSIFDNWLAATPLYAAWMIYAQLEQQNDYRDSGQNAQRSAALLHMMQRDLGDRVGENELWAIGVPLPSKAEMLPELIPQIMFASDDADIDWENSIIRALDREYRQVRICNPNLHNPSLTIASISSADFMTANPRRSGRPSTYPNAKIILAEIFAEYPEYSEYPAKGLLPLFNEKYLIRFGSKIKIAPLGERTLRTHLATYRQELEETGNNKIAN